MLTKRDKRFRTIGGIVSAVIALCCFTPILVIGVTAIGLAGIVGWLDYVLFPLLFLCLGVVIYSFTPKKNAHSNTANHTNLSAVRKKGGRDNATKRLSMVL